MNRLFVSFFALIAVVSLLGTGIPVYGDNQSINQFIDICKSSEKIHNKIDTLDMQMDKHARLQREFESLNKETQKLQTNLSDMTQRLGTISYQLWKMGSDKGSSIQSEQISQLHAESGRLKREIEASTLLLEGTRRAQSDLEPQIRETRDIIEAIAGDNPQTFREHLFAEQEKLSEEVEGLLNSLTDEEKRFAWRNLGVPEETIEEMVVDEQMERGMEYMNRLASILNKVAPETAAGGFSPSGGTLAGEFDSGDTSTQGDQDLDRSEIPDILKNSQAGSARGRPQIVAGSTGTENLQDNATKTPGPDAKIGFSVDTEDVEFEGYIYAELINPDRAIVAIAEQGKEREIRGVEAVTFLVQRGEFYYLAGVGLVSKHRQPASGKNKIIAKEGAPVFKTSAANTLSCDALIKQYDQECGLMHGNAVQAYCAKFDYSGCALDVPSCFSPYLPRQVFAGKACTDEKIRNCLNGSYGGFVGCVRGCNAQAASSGAANLAGCTKGCGETIKAGIESCYGTKKP
ncbi:MAG: hypothetical protein JW902_09465 [Syntrophaceae bacterium]|nr:hypothetical protein [Syntrophaceae bacterium]